MDHYASRSFRRSCRRRHRPYLSRYRKILDRARAKEVTKIFYGYMQTGLYICPGCNRAFEREYQAYCDRCGQKLAWNLFNQNRVTLIKRIPCTVQKRDEGAQPKEKLGAIVP